MLITDISALELWDKGIGSRAVPTGIESLDQFGADAFALQGVRPRDLGVSQPGHLLVAAEGTRPYNSAWHCHRMRGRLAPGSVFQVTESVYIASPELCFFRMAQRLGFIDAIKLGMELCGGYSTLVPLGRDYRKRAALSDAARMAGYLRQMGCGDRSATMRAAREIADGSASPMETAAKILLCLPYRHGCPGFSMPQMNQRVELTQQERRILRREHLRLDLRWGTVGVEFKGVAAHSGESSLAADTARENVLNWKGYSVISATYASLRTVEGFELIVALLARCLGRRLRIPPARRAEYLAAQEATRAVVLRNDTCSWCR